MLLEDLVAAEYGLDEVRIGAQDLFGIFRVRSCQEDQVHDGFQRIIDLVGDRRCHAPSSGDLLGLKEGCFARRLADTSCNTFDALTMLPESSRTGEMLSKMLIHLPLFVRRTVS